jgi:hypothetical protein
LIVSFETEQLQRTCYSLAVAEVEYGAVHAQALITLIADIEAFDNACELIDFFGLHSDDQVGDSLSLAIGSEYRTTLVAVGKKYQRDAGGRLNWSSVRRLKLVDITGCR